jgi:hypothetical protein
VNLHSAIYKLNPSVAVIRNEIAYDINNEIVEYDLKAAQDLVNANNYKEQRSAEYPDFRDYLDGVVKGDQTQIQAYIDACLAVKNKYPKGTL